jgi:uncharacterized membrane protein YfcA
MDPIRVAAGALTGFVVGMTGVGGGALMTPILLFLFGTAPLTAVGTDLWFAAITKLAVSGLHLRSKLIDWPIVARLWAGSLPVSLLTVAWIASRPADPNVVLIVRGAIGVAVCLSAASLLFQSRLRPREGGDGRVRATPAAAGVDHWRWETLLTVATGALLGALVTATSVGAGAVGAVCLYYLYPRRLTPIRLVATDIAHAIPLALCAGIGHLAVSHVDGSLLRDLLVGSVPAALAGATLSGRVTHTVLRRALGAVLLIVGLVMLGDSIR